MNIELYEINVKLSKYQKKKIRKAFCNHEKIELRLKNENLVGIDTLLIPSKSFKNAEYEKKMLKEKLKNAEFAKSIIENGALCNGTCNDTTAGKILEKCYILFKPNVVERLEKTRQTYKGMSIILNYSLTNDLTKGSLIQNIKKLFNQDK